MLMIRLSLIIVLLIVPLLPEKTVAAWALKDYLLSLCAAGVLFGLYLAIRRGRGCSLRSPFGWPLALLLVWAGLSLFWSVARFNGLIEFLRLVGAAVFFYGALYISRSKAGGVARRTQSRVLAADWLLPSLGVGALAASALGLWQVSGGGLRRAEGVFTNSNHLASYLGMIILFLLPFVSSYVFAGRRADERKQGPNAFFYVSFIAIIFTAWGATQSRGALLACLITLSLLIFYYSPELSAYYQRRRAVCLATVFGFVLAVACISWPILKRLQHIEADHLSHARLFIWSAAIKMGLAHPCQGVGLGAFRDFYPAFKEPLLWANNARYAHSEYLHVWNELGIVGLGVWLALIVALVQVLVLLNARGERALAGGLGAAGAVVLLQALVDFNLHSSGILFVFPILAGLSAGRLDAGHGTRDTGHGTTMRCVLLVFSVVLLFVASRHYLATRDHLRGHELLEAGRIPAALRHFERATVHPFMAGAWNSAGNCWYILAAEDELVLARAEGGFRRAISLEPRQLLYLENYHYFLDEQGRYQAALAQLRRAGELAPLNPLLHNKLAEHLLKRSLPEEALRHLKQALKIEPFFTEAYRNAIKACDALGMVSAADEYRQQLAEIEAGGKNSEL